MKENGIKAARSIGGFTLIELMVVLAIIGILAAMSYPSILKRAPHYRLVSAAAAIQSDIEYAQARAVKHNIVHCFQNVGGALNAYQILQDCNGDGVCNSDDQTKCGVGYMVVNANFIDQNGEHYYPNVKFQAAPSPTLYFLPNGGIVDGVSTKNPLSITMELQSFETAESTDVIEESELKVYASGVVEVSPPAAP